MTTTLSVCVLTGGPAGRVGALLDLLRPLADEVVVALDDRADDETKAVLAARADTIVAYAYREPVDRPLRWLHELCSADWILNVDDDEVPSAELLAALPGLVAAGDVTHYWLLRRWLWPDATRTIAEHPWTTDYQLRLVRNDPRLLRFPSETHRPIEAIGPGRYVRAPLYHADLLLNPFERRLAKARKYEALRPGKRVGGGPMNHVFHLPERREPATEPLPDADVALVAQVLEAAAPQAAPADVPHADDAAIERVWAGRAVEPQARIEPLDVPRRLRAGEQRTFDVAVTNESAVTWPWGERGEPAVRVSYHWLAGDDALEGIRTALPADLAPGDTQVVPVHVLAPARPGRYRLRLDLVEEHVRWFERAVELEVEIERPPRVALVGDDAEAIAAALERLTEERPEAEPVVLTSRPAPLHGPPHAPDLRAFLLDGTRRGARDLPLVARRTAELLAAARARRRGEPVRPLLRGGEEFLAAVESATELRLVGAPAHEGTLELLLQTATVRAARALGVEVVVEDGALARPHGALDRLLARAAR
jgi:hypothetical protein